MKSEFDKTDKIAAFRCSINILTKLNCNVPDAYDEERAAEYLKQLSQHWHQDEDRVILTVAQMAQSQVDARLRHMVQQAIESLHLPITADDFRAKWNGFSREEKIGLVDEIISLVEGMKEG